MLPITVNKDDTENK